MNAHTLIRHPAAFETEGLMGYLLRLAENNGYPNIYFMRSDIGLPSNTNRRINIELLTKVANRPLEELRPLIHTSVKGGTKKTLLLGNEVASVDISMHRAAICPTCLVESGFVQAHLSLGVMVACPIHRTPLLMACQACSQPLNWARPGLLKCICGANLAQKASSTAEPAVVDLLDIVRRKALSLPSATTCDSGIPVLKLEGMSLRSLLYLIRSFGRRDTRKPEVPQSWRAYEVIVNSAAKMLADWPNNFVGMLDNLVCDLSPGSAVHLTKGRLSGVYYSLMYGIKPREEAEFVRAELSRYAEDHFGVGCEDRDLLANQQGQSKKYITRKEFAQKVGVDRRYANRVLDTQGLATVRVDGARKRPRYLIAAETLAGLPTRAEGKVYSTGDAAIFTGLPRSVLTLLKREGGFEVNHLPAGIRGFHEKDIDAFLKRLAKLVPREPQKPSDRLSIRLGNLLKGGSSDIWSQAHLIKEVLGGRIAVVGVDGDQVRGLLLDKDAVGRHLLRTHSAANWQHARNLIPNSKNECGGISGAQAAREVGCDSRTVQMLVMNGILRRSDGNGCALWVDGESVDEFRRAFVPITRIAYEAQTTTDMLRRFCKKNEIEMLRFRDSSGNITRSFVRLETKQALLNFRTAPGTCGCDSLLK
jgi:hypothetical protein